MAESGATPIINRPLHPLRIVNGPFQGLHAADGAAQDQAQLPDAQRIQQPRLRPHIVADRDQRKVRAVNLARLRVNRPGPVEP